MKVNFLIIIFLSIKVSLIGQALTGIIVDEYQQGIHEVNILNITTDQHTHSDIQGKFIFEKISIGDTLLLSHIGYQTELVLISELNKRLEIVLNTSSVDLQEIVISPQINVLNLISNIDIQINPVNSSQDVLRNVPGLFIGQHAGGGKAEQLFLRGFDIDHGTDISLTVDGLPVNMVSHAHGQGYADLHFVIP